MRKTNRLSVHLPAGALAILLLLGSPTSLQALPYNWNNAAGGSFNDPTKWTPSGPPAAADYAYFKVAGTYSVSLAGNPTIGRLYFGDIFAGPQAVTFNGGTLNASYGYLGSGAGSANNSLTLDGATTILSTSPTNNWEDGIQVAGSTNRLTIQNGALVATSGVATLAGIGNKLEVDGGTLTAAGGTSRGVKVIGTNNELLVSNGGYVEATVRSVYIGDSGTSGAKLTLTGGTVKGGHVFIGESGAVGSNASVTGAASLLESRTGGSIYVGNNANGAVLTVSNGGTASAGNSVLIGAGTGSGNQVTVTGAGSKLEGKNGNSWQAAVLFGGSANSLTIEAGGTVSTAGGQVQILGTDNAIEIAGGTLAAGGHIGLNCNPYYRSISGTGASLTMSAGSITTPGDLAIAAGSYTQTGGIATVFRLLAGAFGATGTTTTISGPSARLSANTYITSNIIVGHDHSPGLGSANNTLRIENGASVDTLSGGIVGNSSGGGNTLVVSGPGTVFATGMNGQFWDSYLRVDPVGAGNNTVEVGNGATLSVVGLSVGSAPGNAINNNGGVFEFRSDKGLCDPGAGGINLTSGTISYKNTNADVRFNHAAVYPSHPGNAWASGIADITFAGDNTFRMDNSSSVGYWDQTYTYDSLANTGNSRNYQKLELINGTVNIPLGNLTIGTGGAMLVDNTTATVTQSVTNNGAFELTDSATLAVGAFTQAAGTATLAGAMSATTFAQSGGTTILDGTLSVVNPVAITGGLLTGIGTITGNTAIANATIEPGSSPGILTFAGNLGLADTTTLVFDIAGSQTAGLDFDQLVVTGNLTLEDGVAVVFNLTQARRHDVLTLIDAGPGSTLGRLDYGGMLLEDGQAFAVGVYLLQIDYDTANGDVLLTVLIPEPASSLLLLAAAGLAVRRRRPRQLAR